MSGLHTICDCGAPGQGVNRLRDLTGVGEEEAVVVLGDGEEALRGAQPEGAVRQGVTGTVDPLKGNVLTGRTDNFTPAKTKCPG